MYRIYTIELCLIEVLYVDRSYKKELCIFFNVRTSKEIVEFMTNGPEWTGCVSVETLSFSKKKVLGFYK